MAESSSPDKFGNDVLALFELSMAVGSSLDLWTACDTFCHTLARRRNVARVEVWVDETRQRERVVGQPTLVYSYPGDTGNTACVPGDAEFLRILADDGHAYWPAGDSEAEPCCEPGLWFELPAVGYFKVVPGPNADPWTRMEMGMLRSILDKFAVALQGCLAYRQAAAAHEKRRRFESELESARSANKWLTENVADVVWTMNSRLAVSFISPAIKRFAGYDPRDMRTTSFADILDTESLERVRRGVAELRRNGPQAGGRRGTTETMEIGIVTPEGRTVWGEATMCLAKRYEYGDIEVLGVLRDITLRRKGQRQLVRAKTLAEEASRAKSTFLAQMSHEIRTPLGGVMGLSRMLRDTDLRPQQRELVGGIERSAETLMGLINNVLDLSKIEAGMMVLEHRHFGLAALVEDVVRNVAPQAGARGLRFYCDVDPDLPDHFRGDPLRLRQILQNLLHNAVKFTEEGHVILRVAREPGSEDGIRLRFSIADTGPCIPADKRQAVFAAFHRLDEASRLATEGTGLGLAITAHLARLMNADVDVQDRPGGGSVFSLAVTLEPGKERRLQPRTDATDLVDLAGTTVAIIGGDAIEAALLEAQLRSWGMDVAAAGGFKELGPGRSTGDADLVIVMCGSCLKRDGGGDGVCTKVESRYPRAAGLILDPAAGRGDVTRDCYPRDYLVVNRYAWPRMTAPAIRRALGRDGGPAEVRSQSPSGRPLEGRHILVAEDNEINRMIMQSMLGGWGCRVTFAGDGAEAAQAVKRETFDLVLMDVQMPRIDGLEATRIIRGREAGQGGHLPIIALTAHAFTRDRDRCLAAGMDDYLSKPAEPAACFEAITRALGLDTGALPAAGSDPEIERRDVPQSEDDDRPVLDTRRFESATRGDRDFAAHLSRRYLADARINAGALGRALAAGDLAAGQSAAHALKGASLSIGADRLGAQAAETERLCRDGDVDDAVALAARIEATIGLLDDAFAAFLAGPPAQQPKGTT